MNKELRETLADENLAHELATYFTEKAWQRWVADEEKAGEDLSQSEGVLRVQLFVTKHNIDVVFQNSASEIETVFFNSFILSAIKNDVGVWMMNGTVNTPLLVDRMRTRIEETLALYRDFSGSIEGSEKLQEWEDFIDHLLESGEIPHDDADFFRSVASMEPLFRFFNVVMQAGFPDVRVDAKGIRADAYIWIPLHKQLSLVVECDGFKWHSDEDAFSRDRKRDRALKLHGHEILRYSGREIWRDPAAAGTDLLEHLLSLRNSDMIQ